MTIKQFTKKAIDGGWQSTYNFFDGRELAHQDNMFLDPLAWRAVGKVEGWEKLEDWWYSEDDGSGMYCGGILCTEAEYKMHQMIDALIEGKTLEDYLKTL